MTGAIQRDREIAANFHARASDLLLRFTTGVWMEDARRFIRDIDGYTSLRQPKYDALVDAARNSLNPNVGDEETAGVRLARPSPDHPSRANSPARGGFDVAVVLGPIPRRARAARSGRFRAGGSLELGREVRRARLPAAAPAVAG